MNNHAVYITANDERKLRELIWKAQSTDYRNSTYLHMLTSELKRAIIISPNTVPPDVITMNSQASLVDVETGEEMQYTLVFPENADAVVGKISVLAPIGTAMLGYRIGDVFEWGTPGGVRRIRVEKVIYQPEAAGDFQ